MLALSARNFDCKAEYPEASRRRSLVLRSVSRARTWLTVQAVRGLVWPQVSQLDRVARCLHQTHRLRRAIDELSIWMFQKTIRCPSSLKTRSRAALICLKSVIKSTVAVSADSRSHQTASLSGSTSFTFSGSSIGPQHRRVAAKAAS